MIKPVLIRIFHQIFVVLSFVLISAKSYCQPEKQRTNINQVYRTETKRLLIPQNPQAPHSLAYIVHPEIDPDYSICLIDSSGQSYLEMRCVDKNIWYELITRFTQNQDLSLPIKTSVYSIAVSKRFKHKMFQALMQVKPIKLDPFVAVFYDGDCYEFIWIKKGKSQKVEISYGLKSETYEYNLINQLSLLNSEIKKNLFKESNYIKRFKIERLKDGSKHNQHQQN